MKPDIIPKNLAGKELYDFIVKNEELIKHAKKSTLKFTDAAFSMPLFINEKGQMIDKAEVVEALVSPTKIKVSVVINTTNWLDSHGDVHIPGLWKKSLSDNKQGFYLLDNHNKCFEDVIAEGCTGETKTLSWKDFGINIPGATEALIFTGVVDKERNEFMFSQYQKGYVKKHSVGMRYIKMLTCIDDEDYPVQKENWDKYFPMVANGQEAEDEGFFFAVLEAQVVEGSAVLFASNCMTPTLEVSNDDTKNQPAEAIGTKPSEDQIEKSKAICPNCKTITASANCPSCGQFVSPTSTRVETFDLISAINETIFIKH